jgi:hypothetical protein
VSDGHAHAGLFDNNRITLSVFHRSRLPVKTALFPRNHYFFVFDLSNGCTRPVMYNSFCQGEKEWGTILNDSRKTNKGATPMLPAVIASIEQAFREIKTYSIESWEGEYRSAARMALKEILQIRMSHWVDRGLQELASRGMADRRNGYFSRHLLTELGDLELAIPRSCTFSAISLCRWSGAASRACRTAGVVSV